MKKIIAVFILMLIASPVFASDYHILKLSKNGRSAQVAFHISIPDVNNSASYSYRSAVSEYVGGVNFVSQVPWALVAQEQTDLEAGLLYEVIGNVHFAALDNNAQKQAKIDAKFTSISADALSELQAVLAFWQFNRDVP